MGEAAFVDDGERALEHRLVLGRKARDDVGAEDHVGTQPPDLFAEGDGVGPQMPPLHALEDEIVARLQREMQVRHEPRLVGDRIEKIAVGLDGVDRRDAQALELGHVPQDRLHEGAEGRLARADPCRSS